MSENKNLVWDNDEAEFNARDRLNGHIAAESVRTLLKQHGETFIIDRTEERKELKSGMLLALSLLLSQHIKETVEDKRVGIVLPPGAGGMIANLAVVLADKVPVNFNFTLGRDALESSLKLSQVNVIVTAEAMRDKLTNFPWTDQCIRIGETIKSFSKFKILATLAATRLMSERKLFKKFDIPDQGGDREAALLFTSGSAGEPKGVILTHRNILGNIEQLDSYGVLSKDDTVMSCLPFFHSFGFTVTLFYATIKGLKVVTSPNPLQVAKIIEAIEEEKATVHIGTPTFFRPYLRKAKREQLASLRAVVAGAEKTPEGFHDMWEERFGSKYLEGYGLTETTPVVACNLPLQDGNRRGSVGKLFPGMSARVLNPDTREPQPVGQQGILCLKGCNVFGGYLENPKATSEAIDSEGWFVSGDLARIDEDGFLYIEGRLSRFSKIGGEMVPHITVEQAIAKAYGMDDSEVPVLVVTGRADEDKGEELVLVSTLDIDIKGLRDELSAAGISLPNLWIPRIMVKVEKIPVLASGKLDIKRIRQTAEEGKVIT